MKSPLADHSRPWAGRWQPLRPSPVSLVPRRQPRSWLPRAPTALSRCALGGRHPRALAVMFTAAWEFVVNFNWKFPVVSERVGAPSSTHVHPHQWSDVPALRGRCPPSCCAPALIYTLWTYSVGVHHLGFILRQFNVLTTLVQLTSWASSP